MKNRRKHADIIIAWAEGAEIEVCSDKSDIQTPARKPTWNIDCKYRVKPEYVPYEAKDYKEASALVGRTIEHIEGQNKVIINSVSVHIGKLFINGRNADIMFRHFILCDGTPIGKLK